MAQAKGSTKTAANPIAGSFFRFWTPTLDRRAPIHWGYVDGSDAAQTLALNALTILPVLTASRNVTLPVINAKGDRCWVMRPTGSTTLNAILLTGAGNTCVLHGRTVNAASEITRLFNAGEYMGFFAYSSTAWQLDIGGDGRTPCRAEMYLSTASTGNTAATSVYPTDFSGAWTTIYDSGGMITLATGAVTVRRTGRAWVMANYRANASMTALKYFNAEVAINAGGLTPPLTLSPGAGPISAIPAIVSNRSVVVGDTLRMRYRTEEANIGASAAGSTTLIYDEILG